MGVAWGRGAHEENVGERDKNQKCLYTGSNRGPSGYESDALPTELWRQAISRGRAQRADNPSDRAVSSAAHRRERDRILTQRGAFFAMRASVPGGRGRRAGAGALTRAVAIACCACGTAAFSVPHGPTAAARAPRRAPRHGAIHAVAEQPMLDKRNERRRIMSSEYYKRGGSPFDKDIHKEVNQKMSAQFKSDLVEEMKARHAPHARAPLARPLRPRTRGSHPTHASDPSRRSRPSASWPAARAPRRWSSSWRRSLASAGGWSARSSWRGLRATRTPPRGCTSPTS